MRTEDPDPPFDENSAEWDESSTLIDLADEPGAGAVNEKQALVNLTIVATETERLLLASLKAVS